MLFPVERIFRSPETPRLPLTPPAFARSSPTRNDRKTDVPTNAVLNPNRLFGAAMAPPRAGATSLLEFDDVGLGDVAAG